MKMKNKKIKETKYKEQNILVGKYFHTFKTDEKGKKKVVWQGRVNGQIYENFFLVEIFDWGLGGGEEYQVITLEDMKGWDFYKTAELMRTTYEEVYQLRDKD